MFYLEQLVGRELFERFVRDWILSHRHKSVTTAHFQEFFLAIFGEPVYNKVEWDAWLYSPGLPHVNVSAMFDDSLAVEARALASAWITFDQSPNSSEPSLEAFSTLSVDQKVHFLEDILSKSPKGLSLSTLKQLDGLYGLTPIRNSEIRMAWLSLSLTSKDPSSFPAVEEFVSEQGRMKFIRPLYRLLAQCGEEGLAKATSLFDSKKSFYHNIASRLVAQDLAKFTPSA